eukprot:1150706-Pelagomonas_calceolata.AAC.9
MRLTMLAALTLIYLQAQGSPCSLLSPSSDCRGMRLALPAALTSICRYEVHHALMGCSYDSVRPKLHMLVHLPGRQGHGNLQCVQARQGRGNLQGHGGLRCMRQGKGMVRSAMRAWVRQEADIEFSMEVHKRCE